MSEKGAQEAKDPSSDGTIAMAQLQSTVKAEYIPKNNGQDVYNLPYRWRVLSKKKSKQSISSRQSLFQLPDNKTKQFINSIKRKDVKGVQEQLDNDPDLTTSSDEQGVSAIEQAVLSGSVEMIKLFLSRTGRVLKAMFIEHALLYSIQLDQVDIVRFLLEERGRFWAPVPRKASVDATLSAAEGSLMLTSINGQCSRQNTINLDKFKTWADKKNSIGEIPGFENSGYSPYITPITLASKLQRLDIIKLLLDNDASEIHPLTMECPFEDGQCEICIERKVFKSRRDLEDSYRLLEIYKALSSPAYIFLSGVTDPILEAFELSWEMSKMQNEDPSFKTEYEEIAAKCRCFATEMLELCRTSSEVETFLKRETNTKKLKGIAGDSGFSRIIVAMYFQQKEFVAHRNCQQTLEKSWYEGLPNWVCDTELHYVMLVLYVLLWVPLWPLACVCYMLKFWPWVIRLMKYPINKFITDTLSFLTFIALLILNDISYEKEGKDLTAGKLFNIAEFLIIIWILGMSARHVKMLYRHRNYGLFARKLCGFDTFFFLCFWFWWISRTIGIIYVRASGKSNLTRNEWEQGHPVLISEAFFALGTILSLVRFTGLFKASSALGPLQISLKRMILDIVRFFFIFVIIMSGFVIATTKIYTNYKNNESHSADGVKPQLSGYIGFENSYKMFFWSIFGYGDVLESANIVVDHNGTVNHHVNSSLPSSVPAIPHHKFTESVGYWVIGSYHVVAVVVLLNMLIAMMANSFNAIQENSDREWKFARTRLRMIYYCEVGSLPPPFNIAILGSIMKLVVKLCGKCSQTCRDIENPYQSKLKDNAYVYQNLLEKLNKRYWNKQKLQDEGKIVIRPGEFENLLREHSKELNV